MWHTRDWLKYSRAVAFFEDAFFGKICWKCPFFDKMTSTQSDMMFGPYLVCTFWYVFDNNWAENLRSIRDGTVTKLWKKSGLKLIFSWQLDRVKLRAIFHFFFIFVFFSRFCTFRNSKLFFKAEKVLNK